MLKEINKDRLKMKSLVSVKTDQPVEAYDFLYEMFQAFDEKGWDPGGRGATVPQLKWAGLNQPIHGLTIEESLSKVEELGFIKVTQMNGTSYHTIIKHPWI